MKCLQCQAMIDEDSFFCDQCGEEILVCSQCRKPGKGKRCIYDGKLMVALKDNDSAGNDTLIMTPGASTAAPPPQPQTAPAVSPNAVGSTTDLILTHKLTGQQLAIGAAVTIGRKNGELTGFFGNFAAISSTHAALEPVNNSWTVSDLGSTNGTYINGQPLPPNQKVPLTSGMILTFADVEFSVTLPQGNSETMRL